MKFKKIFAVTSASLVASSLLLSTSAHAAAMTDQQMQQTIIQLQKEVNSLSGEVKELKGEEIHYGKTAAEQKALIDQNRQKIRQNQQLIAQEGNKTTGRREPYPYEKTPTSKLQAENFTRGATVTTSPYLGLRSAFDASDLVVNISTMNEDLRLLQQRETIEQAYRDAHLAPFASDRPILELSGTLEAQGIYQDTYVGPSTTDIDLTKAEIDFLSYISPWVLGIMTIDYDNTPLPGLTNPDVNIAGVGQRIGNSRSFS